MMGILGNTMGVQIDVFTNRWIPEGLYDQSFGLYSPGYVAQISEK